MAMEEPVPAGAASRESLSHPDDLGSAAPSGEASSIDLLIERWWQDYFPGSAVARDTHAWNVAHAAKETLKRLLKRSI
jgi:hypothetical protein